MMKSLKHHILYILLKVSDLIRIPFVEVASGVCFLFLVTCQAVGLKQVGGTSCAYHKW